MKNMRKFLILAILLGVILLLCSKDDDDENPNITVSTSSLDFGSSSSSETFEITNSGDGTLSWSISDNKSWISVSPISGSTASETDEVTVTVDRDELSTGTHTGKITVDAGDAGTEEITISVVKEIVISFGTFTDPRDGYTYKTMIIGDQTWLAENLRATTYRNGDSILNVTDYHAWEETESGAYCAYGFRESHAETYGYLYNWYAVNDSRELAPEGWHVPTDAEWTELEEYLIANGYNYDGSTTGNKIGKSLASTSGWGISTETGDIGNEQQSNNTTGFSALPGGCRDGTGMFIYLTPGGNPWTASEYISHYAYFWSASEYSSFNAWCRVLYYDNEDFYRDYYNKQGCFSIRCLRD